MSVSHWLSGRQEQGRDLGLLLLRLGAGLSLFWLHGSSKFASASAYLWEGQEWKFIAAVESLGFPFPALFAVAAALAESLAAVLVAIGLATRVSAAVVAFTMLTALYGHLKQGQGGELASVYLYSALTLVLTGAGRYSLDHYLQRSRSFRRSAKLEAEA